MAEYEASGLGRSAFCRKRGLSLSTLARYRRRRKHAVAESAKGKRWLAVEVSGTVAGVGEERASGLAVVLSGGRRVEVGRSFDGDTLQRLLAVLERGGACLG